jgi:hypothetical protein
MTLARCVGDLRPALIVCDTFAVVGRVVATLLDVPYVNVCAGHNVQPASFVATLATDPRVAVSRRCYEAVEVLRRYGIADATPFSYVSGTSPVLNIYCEPPQFLDLSARRAFEPLAFFGSLPSLDQSPAALRSPQAARPGRRLVAYASFGTVVWRYYADTAFRALKTLAEYVGGLAGAELVCGIGGTELTAEQIAALTRANVSVQPYVDQWQLLADVDLFVTHHGLNSTHEAIFHGVPMVSYPFFWDQPELAEICQRFGCAVALGAGPLCAFDRGDVDHAWRAFLERRDAMVAALSTAREWELAVVAQRPLVIEQLLDLARRPAAGPARVTTSLLTEGPNDGDREPDDGTRDRVEDVDLVAGGARDWRASSRSAPAKSGLPGGAAARP